MVLPFTTTDLNYDRLLVSCFFASKHTLQFFNCIYIASDLIRISSMSSFMESSFMCCLKKKGGGTLYATPHKKTHYMSKE